MSIEFLCSDPECRTKLEVGDDLAGKKVRCPKCKVVSVAPEPTPDRPQSGLEALDGALHRTRRHELPYDAVKELARGGMGAIILGNDRVLGRPLAVKVMRPDIQDSEERRVRFLDEAQITAQLEHPNIVPVHELGKNAQGDLYVTMKLVKGKSLGEILKDLKTRDQRPETGDRRKSRREDRSGEAEDRPSGGRLRRGSALQSRESQEEPEKTPGLETQATFSLSDLLNIYLKVCDGMAFAHSKGVIHRDLKPDNIMVGEFGEVQIMDWGLAKVVGDRGQGTRDEGPGEEEERRQDLSHQSSVTRPESEIRSPKSAIQDESAIRKADTVRSVRSESDVALTVDGQITGTPAYMPPEQAEGKLEMIDHRSDVYSLGAILYEIMTLERPIEGDTVHKVLLNVSDGRITPPEQRTPGRHVPKELSAVVMKAMATNRRKRYQSVQELSQDIKLFLEGRAVSAKEDTFVEAFGKLIKRNKGVSAAIAAAAVILLVIGAAFTYDNAKKRRIAEDALEEAQKSERKAIAAQQQQRETALEASMELALQAVRAAEGGRMGEAAIRAEAAEKLAPDGPWGHYAWGKVAMERKDFETAEERLREAVAIPPENERCKTALAQLLTLLGKLEEAAELAKGDTATKDWSALRAAGDAFYTAERYRDAERMYAAAIKQLDHPQRVPKEDKDWRPVLEKADALFAARLYPDAKASYEKAASMMKTAKVVPTPVVLATEEKLKKAKEAFAELKTDLELALGNARVWIKCKGFYESVRFLPAEEQIERLEAKLQNVHGQKVKMGGYINDGVLYQVNFYKPLDALKYLQPLRGLALTYLYMPGCTVSDLTPLRGMPLRTLGVHQTRVSDLGPLRGMPLEELHCSDTRVSDLSPVRGMRLTRLGCSITAVSDLSPLKGMPLEALSCDRTNVTDLSPLKGMPLKFLTFNSTQVRSIEPLVGMRLEVLQCGHTKVADLAPLAGMPLKSLFCDQGPVGDLSPLKGMPLETLCCHVTQVSDLSPLEGMPLKKLTIHQNSKIVDVTPLKGMPLRDLAMHLTSVTDLSPLQGMELERLTFDPGKITKGIEILREMETIKEIGTDHYHLMKPEEFWKKYDAGEFR